MQTQQVITPLGGRRGRNPAFQDPQVKQALVRLHSQVNALKPQGSLLRADMQQFIAKPVLQYMAQTNPDVQKVFNGNQHSQPRKDAQGQIRNGSAFFTWCINAFAGMLSDIVLRDNIGMIIHGDRNTQKANRALASGGWNQFKRTCSKQIASWYLVNRQRALNQYVAHFGSNPQQMAGVYTQQPGFALIIQAAVAAVDGGFKTVGAMLRSTGKSLGNLVPLPGQSGAGVGPTSVTTSSSSSASAATN